MNPVAGADGVVRVVAGPAVSPGFALAGVAVEPDPVGGDVGATLARAAAREGTALVLVEERLFETLPAEVRRRWEKSLVPVVVPFPSPVAEAGRLPADRVVELIRRAIGYRVRLR